MTITYGFYNSVNGDRKYDAEEFSQFFDGILNDGVLPAVGQKFYVTSDTLAVIVGSGRAWYNNTWTKNDAGVSVNIPSPSTVNHRVDALVIQVDTRDAYRQNTLEWVLGTPSASPVAPALTPPTGVYQYALAHIRRNRDVNNITQASITQLVGSTTTPFASNALIAEQTFDTLSHKRNVVRGNFLGTTMTAAQKLAVREGTFDGLYLGDYWTHSGTNWRIVDFDYWLGRQKTRTGTRISEHHLVILPDDTRNLYPFVRPFTTARTAANCGYYFAAPIKNRDQDIANRSKTLFGTNGILARNVRYPSALSTARFAMNSVDQQGTHTATSLTEQQLYGARNLSLPMSDPDFEQLALFKHGVRNFWMGHDAGQVTIPSTETQLHMAAWMIGQYVVDRWVCVHDWGGAFTVDPVALSHAKTHQVRPIFGVTGR